MVSLGISAALLTLLLTVTIGVTPTDPAVQPSADLVGVQVDGNRLDAFLPSSADGPRPAVVVEGGDAEAEQLAARGYVAVSVEGERSAPDLAAMRRWVVAHADALGVTPTQVSIIDA